MAPNCSMTIASGPAKQSEVESIAVQSFCHLFRFRVVGEEADGTVAIGEEINRVADPHRMVIVGILARNFDDAGIFEISDPDRGGLSTVIALPGLLPFGMRNVSYMRSIGREMRPRRWKRQRSRESAVDRTVES